MKREKPDWGTSRFLFYTLLDSSDALSEDIPTAERSLKRKQRQHDFAPVPDILFKGAGVDILKDFLSFLSHTQYLSHAVLQKKQHQRARYLFFNEYFHLSDFRLSPDLPLSDFFLMLSLRLQKRNISLMQLSQQKFDNLKETTLITDKQ